MWRLCIIHLPFFLKRANSLLLWNSTKIRWPQNWQENFQWFQSEFWWPASLIIQQFRWLWNSTRIRWPRKCFGILHRFLSKFWWPVLLSNNLDDHRILMKLVLDFIKILQELDDHGNNMTIFNDFDQNSGCQPHYQTIQMATEFFKN